MEVYCPRCADQAPTGQRFCRKCGLKLDIIVDAMEGRQMQFDPESLKEGLRTLGDSLRVGFENFKQEAKNTRRLKQEETGRKYNHEWIGDLAQKGGALGADIGTALGGFKPADKNAPTETRADRKLKQALAKKLPATRKYSLQQGVLQIMSGATSGAVWYVILKSMTHSGALQHMVESASRKIEIPADGIVALVQLLWLFAAIPVATGIGHLINGAFFAATPEDLRLDVYQPPQLISAVQPQAFPASVSAVPSAVPTNELERAPSLASITEEETRRLAERNAQAS